MTRKLGKMIVLLTILAFPLMLAVISYAAVDCRLPSSATIMVPYMGNLSGVSGSHNVAFKIYDAKTGGTQLWSLAAQPVTLTGGLFSINLGPFTRDFLCDLRERYLAIELDGPEFKRDPFTTSPYVLSARSAEIADSVPASGITGTVAYATKASTADVANGLLASSVTSSMIEDLTIQTIDIGDNQVTGAKLQQHATDNAQRAVGSDHIKANAVTAEKIKAGVVDGTKLAPNSIISDHIADGQVMTNDIGDGQVTSSKLVSGAVTTAKLAPDAVTSDKIVDGEVKTADLATSSVDSMRLRSSASVNTDRAVTTDHIRDKAVTGAKIADIGFVKVACNKTAGCSDSTLGQICDVYKTKSRPLSVSCDETATCKPAVFPPRPPLRPKCSQNSACCGPLTRDTKIGTLCASTTGMDAIVYCVAP